MTARIFLNYRRGDDPGTVGRLFDRLEQAFARDQIFMDVEGHIKAGDDYVEVLRDQVAQCDVLLAVIGPRWLTITDEAGRPRLDNAQDWVRVEIASALEAAASKRVIPVLVGGAEMPRAEDLPADLVGLARKQAVRLTLERFKSDTQGLVTQVMGVLADLETARTAQSEVERKAAEAALKKQEVEERARAEAIAARGVEQRQSGMSPDDVRKAEELANWEFIKAKTTIQDFRDHLARFPAGVTVRYARERLAAVVWAQIGKRRAFTEAESELRAFVEEFPSSEHADEARSLIDAGEAAVAAEQAAARQRAEETAAWATAASGDKAAVTAFLKAWPSGAHADAGKTRLRELSGGRFSRRSVLKGVGYGVGGTATLGVASVAGFSPGSPGWRLLNDQSIRTFRGHDARVAAVAVAPDGRTAISASKDGTLKAWDIASARVERTYESHGGALYAVAISPDGKIAISGGEDKILKVWDTATGAELRSLTGHSDWVNAVVTTRDGKVAISGSRDRTLKLWDVSTGRAIRPLSGHSDSVRAVAVAPDGRTAISGARDDTLKIWDISTGREVRTLTGHSDWVLAVALTPDGKTAVSGSRDNTVKVWDIATGRMKRSLEGNSDDILAVAVAPDGKTAVSGGNDRTVQLWDIESGTMTRKLTGHTESIYAIAITPDGKFAISGSDDNTLKVWNLS